MRPLPQESLQFSALWSKLWCFFTARHFALLVIAGCCLRLLDVVQAFPTMAQWQPTVVHRQEAASPVAEPSAASLLREQLMNPKEVLAVLLLLGGDIIQKAIAQNTGLIITPVAFSFGWVSYALASLLSVFGEGLLMPDSDSSCVLINPESRNIKQNESWMLGRLIRDLEFEFDLRHKDKSPENDEINKMPLVITRWSAETTYKRSPKLTPRGKKARYDYKRIASKADWIWWSYVPVLIAEMLIAAFPPWFYNRDNPDWRILFITGVGNLLSLFTASIDRWQKEKFYCRSTTGEDPITFILTRGNSHRHVFVIYVDTNTFAHNLEDLAIRRRDPISNYVGATFAVLALFWLFLLIAIGGLEEDTWYLLLVGTIGMVHSILVAAAPRTSNAHGIPLTLKKQELVGRKHGDKIKIKSVMDVLILAEKSEPGIGYALLDVFFPGGPRVDDVDFWEDSGINWEGRRVKKYMKEHPNGPLPRYWEQRPLRRRDRGTPPKSIESSALKKTRVVQATQKNPSTVPQSEALLCGEVGTPTTKQSEASALQNTGAIESAQIPAPKQNDVLSSQQTRAVEVPRINAGAKSEALSLGGIETSAPEQNEAPISQKTGAIEPTQTPSSAVTQSKALSPRDIETLVSKECELPDSERLN
ncbi:hypothetical protein L207DRAFT_565035 [Hyaloscypha variabilis F]|uniref:Uncharacterized protein n=1 Tax=Hyaloscypha variabilis (strain UAMH 11265 / GT02V1 / F) TaxID=1149755 RepID=A0A2J6RWE0_HYAVF|nr:hypothetical protein L207DRAFT_565035 [Hyaloscypha variabilis F]